MIDPDAFAQCAMEKALLKLRERQKNRIKEIVKEIKRINVDREKIINELRKRGPLTIPELSKITGIGSSDVFRHIIALRKFKGIVEVGKNGCYYLYKLKES